MSHFLIIHAECSLNLVDPESVGMTGQIVWQAQQISHLVCSLAGLRNFLNTDKSEHHSIDHLKERGAEKGSGRYSTLQGPEQSVFNQANIGTVSRATLGRLLRDGAERMSLSERYDAILS